MKYVKEDWILYQLKLLQKKANECDIQEYNNFVDFPSEGKKNVLYIDLGKTKSYIWDGTKYCAIEDIDEAISLVEIDNILNS